MPKRKSLLIAIACLACIVAIIFTFRPTVSMTVADVEILEEDAASVLVRYRGEIGRMFKSYADDFSNPIFLDWFGDERWTTIDTLSPSSPSLEAYVALREKIFRGESGFLDNRIEAVEGMAKFTAHTPSETMVTSKALLEHNRLWFVKGDDLWFRGRYLLKEGVPFTIADFQERGRHNSPGPRITIWDQEHLGYELKAGWKPRLRQSVAKVPIGEWFELTVHLVLDEAEGRVQIWQDGLMILDETVATLAASDSLLNALEVGITATGQACEVWVDDVEISHERLEPSRPSVSIADEAG